jgi:hypothetical protein
MEKGIIWRIGDGMNVHIWEDPWIPSGFTRRPRTPRGSTVLSRVSDLIDPYAGTWDIELVKDLFWEEDVPNILAIPVHVDREDMVAWHFDHKGVFSVKSAYHVLEDEAESLCVRQKGESSNTQSIYEGKLWKKIWRLPGPPKIKQLVWRVAHNSLAFKLNISRKSIRLDTKCPVCFRFDEDGAHCFLKCKAVRQCWRELGIETFRVQLLLSTTAEEFVMEVLKLRTDICIRVIVLLWRWWDVRNKMNAGELMPSCQETVWSVMSMVQDILKNDPKAIDSPAPKIQRWLPPPVDYLKINVDGAYKMESKNGAWGFIVRDHEGSTVLAGAGNLGPVHDALIAETLACKQALEAAVHFGISQVLIETDSSQLMEAITSSSSDLAIGGGLFKEIRGFLQESSNCLNVCKIPRSCNSCTHDLASFGYELGPGSVPPMV